MSDRGTELEQRAREWLKANKPVPPSRPTIAELEELLKTEDPTPVEINPDGSIGVGSSEREVKLLAAFAASEVSAAEAKLSTTTEQTAEEWRTNNGYHTWDDRRAGMFVDAKTSALQDRVRELERHLGAIRRTPAMPFPDASAHSLKAFSGAVYAAWARIQQIADAALGEKP